MKTIIHRIFLVSVIGICQEDYSIKMIWIDFLHTPVSTLYMALLSNRPGHGLHSHKKNTTYLRCLGVFICPMDGCKHVSNAVLSNGKRQKDSIPKPRGSGLCFTHKCPLTHMSCKVNSLTTRVADMQPLFFELHDCLITFYFLSADNV